VCPAIQGITVGLGMGSALLPRSADNALTPGERAWAAERNLIAETVAAKRAILDALGMDKESSELWTEIEVRLDVGNRVYVKAMKSVQQRAWALRAIDYKIAFSRGASEVISTATAIADVSDISA
jgi:phosphopantetheinyl transferase (holo-ACP synthase)